MTEKTESPPVSVIHPVCCGLDVHKKKISACLITVGALGDEKHEVREFGTFTDDLAELRQWILENDFKIL